MAKVRKVKRRKTYKVNINRKRLRNKMRKLPNITCPQIKEAWENSKSTRRNLVQMGLAYDPNKSLKIPNVKTEMVRNTKQIASGKLIESNANEEKRKRVPKKIQVAIALEEDSKAPRESMFRLPKGQVQFLTNLMDKYGDDYEAMARDKKNFYQLTWRQIRSKINTLKGIPEQYAEYLLKNGEIILDNPEPLKDTMKKIAEENVKKYCAPKKVKKQKQTISQWVQESIEDENPDVFDTLDTLQDEDGDGETKLVGTDKKFALFSDDESDHDDNPKIEKKKRKRKKNLNVKENQSQVTMKCGESSDDECDLKGDDDDDALSFKSLNSISDDDVSDDDMLDDDEFDVYSD